MDKNSIPCATCKLRAKYDNNPKSLSGRFWRWHIGFCPGWKAYMNAISEEERQAFIEKYNLKK
jgi:hypothetical protein